ncbi:MAG: hypothetical protein Kapaf2KO_21540 [Candidatus Kapaibacteriales bacterium]
MKKTVLITLVLFFSSALFANNTDEVMAEIKTKYNSGEYGKIFDLMDQMMQSAMPKENTIAFFTNLKTNAGNINGYEYAGKAKGIFNSYKTVFEKGTFLVNLSADTSGKINGMFVQPYIETTIPTPERNSVQLSLPFKGEWDVVWGGDTKEQNYHVESKAQKNAFDIVIKDDEGKTFKTNGRTNEDFYVFGKELIAPCAGEVVMVVDGVPDNVPGEVNPIYVPGNTVVIKAAENEYLFFAHFKEGSITVKKGQKVNKGDLLGLCGNSGNSSEPHLHFHIQNQANMINATGVKAYFDNILVNGEPKDNYSPIQGERIRNR